MFSKVLFTSNALKWLDVFGNFLYSRPETETNYQQFNEGNFVISNAALFLTTQQFALASRARMPHTAGSVGAEIRPLPRTRVMVSWLTDRLENKGTASFNSLLRNEYNQSDVDIIVDATRQVTLRGGYRYVWGDARNVVTPSSGLLSAESAELKRHVGKGGFTYRPATRLSISADLEAAASSRVYFRTTLNDSSECGFERGIRPLTRSCSRLTPHCSITKTRLRELTTISCPETARFRFSGRPQPQSESCCKAVIPGVRFDLTSPTSLLSFLERERSFYRDNAHTLDGRVDLVLPAYAGMAPRLSFGGAFFFSSGSRPTEHYQPLGSLTVPMTRSLAWISEWRYHGFGESFYGFEAFRVHLITTGLRFSR